MKELKIAVLGAALTAAAAPLLFAGPRLCANGLPPRLSGDAFSPVECSSATLPAPALPGLPARLTKSAITDLRALEGRWTGNAIQAMGRYDLVLTVKTTWRGKIEAVLDLKELQFRDRLTDRLVLTPGKERGVYGAELTASLAPEASLSGKALVAEAVGPEGATATDRQLDLAFTNGASHRFVFALNKDGSEMRARVFSAIPGAPLQSLELVLVKAKR